MNAIEQLSLFQRESPNDTETFKSLEAMKKETQEFFENIKKTYKIGKKVPDRRVYYLDVRTQVESISESEVNTPETPRVLIRRYKSILRGKLENCSSEPLFSQGMVTPFWALKFYSDDRADSYWFAELSRRIRSVSFMLEAINDKKVQEGLKAASDALKIICMDHLLWLNIITKELSIFTEMEQSNYLAKFRLLRKEAEKNGCILIGHSRYFRSDDILKEMAKKNPNKQYGAFGNDYVLLNNVEFPWEQEPNTVGWPEILIPHYSSGDQKVLEDNHCMYCKNPPTGVFSRIEIGTKIDNNILNFLAKKCVDKMDNNGFLDIK